MAWALLEPDFESFRANHNHRLRAVIECGKLYRTFKCMELLYEYMDETNCPIDGCDYSSESSRGVSIHASSAHPDEDVSFTSKEEFACDFCGATFERYPSSVHGKNAFCSKDCKNSFEAKDGLDTECSECGDDVHIPPSQIKEVDGYEQKNHFCNKECESAFKSREWVGEDHPSWDGGRDRLYCEECGDEYYVKPAVAESSIYCSRECTYKGLSVDEQEYECANCGDTVYKMPHNVKDKTTCSMECFKQHLSSIRRGEDNPQWKGGRFDYYGPNWNQQRKKALERDDYTCQECGMTRQEHYSHYGRDLDVHHKVPRRQVIDENNPTIEQFELANSLDNLLTLCSECHRKLEPE